MVQWLRLWASAARGVGEWVPSLAGEVRYYMLPVAAKKVKKKTKKTKKQIKKKKWLFGRRLDMFYRKFARLA